MRAKLVNEGYGQKDIVRMEDIRTKSDGDHDKEVSLATTQAKIIKNPAKAKARAEAAEEVFGPDSDLAMIFHDRARELGGNYAESSASRGSLKPVTHAPKKGEKLEREYETKFFLPSEKGEEGQKSFNRGAGEGFRRGGGGNTRQGLGVGRQFGVDAEAEDREPKHLGGASIAPLGSINLGSGHSKFFNVKDEWKDGTVEVWKNTDSYSRQGKYRMIFNSGEYRVPGVIGDRKHFQHDQTWNDMGMYKLVDWVPMDKLDELIRKYGNSMPGAVYK